MNFFKRGDRPSQHQDDLAHQCRQFYHRRLQMAQEATEKWSSTEPASSTTASPRSTPSDSSVETKSLASSESSCSSAAATAVVGNSSPSAAAMRSCSTLPRKLKTSKVNVMAKRSVDDFLLAVDKEAAAAATPNDRSSLSRAGATAGRSDSFLAGTADRSADLFDPEVLPSKISQLRQDLLSLINLDNELFKHLLTINDTLEELREQRNVPKLVTQAAPAAAAATADFKLGYYEPPGADMVTELLAAAAAEDEYVGPFTSLPDHTYMLQKQQLLQQQQQLGNTGLKNGLKFMLRSRSFLMKPIIAKRRISGTSESTVKTKIPVKVTPPHQPPRPPHQPASLPHIQENGEGPVSSGSRSGTLKKLSLSSKKSTFSPSAAAAAAAATPPSSSTLSRPTNFNRPLFHMPHQSRSKQLWQKVFEANAAGAVGGSGGHDEPDGFPKITHMKQNSYDSGIHHGSESASD